MIKENSMPEGRPTSFSSFIFSTFFEAHVTSEEEDSCFMFLGEKKGKAFTMKAFGEKSLLALFEVRRANICANNWPREDGVTSRFFLSRSTER
jgi:hypothetical protein